MTDGFRAICLKCNKKMKILKKETIGILYKKLHYCVSECQTCESKVKIIVGDLELKLK